MNKIFIILFAFLSLSINAQFIVSGGGPSTQGEDISYDTTNYYWKDLAHGGDDGNSGHHLDSAKTSITALAALAIDPGDTIFMVTDNIWRLSTTLIFDDWVGTDVDRIVLKDYGGGNKPRILGSDTITDYVDVGSNVWVGVKVSIDTFPGGRIVYEETDGTYTWGILVTSVSEVNSVDDYYWSRDSLYVYSTSDPSSAFTSIEIPQLGDIMQVEDPSEYLSIDGMEIAYGTEGHIFRNGYPGNGALKGLEIRNNHFHHKGVPDDGSTGMDVNYTDMIIEYNTVHDIGRRLISILDYDGNETQIRNALIQNNVLYNGYHSAIDIFGLNEDSPGISNFTIRNNFISLDATSTESPHFIYLDDQTGSPGSGTCPVDSMFVYNNIMIGTASSAIICDEVSNAFLYHNTCWASNPLVSFPQQFSFTERATNCRSFNNLLFDQDYRLMLWTSGAPPDSMDYNLYWQTVQTSHFVDISTTRYRLDTQWDAYKTATSLDGNSPDPADPNINEGSWLDINGPTYPEWSPNIGSPAINTGIKKFGLTTDFYGNVRSDPPDIGAVESQSGWVSPTSKEDDQWDNSERMYDDDLGTYGSNSTNGRAVTLLIDAINCSKVRIYAGRAAGGAADLNIDVYYSAGWHSINEGTVTEDAWDEIEIGSTETVTKARITAGDGIESQVMEFEFESL